MIAFALPPSPPPIPGGLGDTLNITTNVSSSCSGSSTQSCTVANGVGTQSRTCANPPNWSVWGTCTVVSCNAGYTRSGNICVAVTCTAPNTQNCTISGSIGYQTRTCSSGVWSPWSTCTVNSSNDIVKVNASIAADTITEESSNNISSQTSSDVDYGISTGSDYSSGNNSSVESPSRIYFISKIMSSKYGGLILVTGAMLLMLILVIVLTMRWRNPESEPKKDNMLMKYNAPQGLTSHQMLQYPQQQSMPLRYPMRPQFPMQSQSSMQPQFVMPLNQNLQLHYRQQLLQWRRYKRYQLYLQKFQQSHIQNNWQFQQQGQQQPRSDSSNLLR